MSCEREGGESEDSRLTHVGTVVCAGAATQHSSLAVPQKAADRDMLPHRLGGRTILKVRVAMGVVAFASWSSRRRSWSWYDGERLERRSHAWVK